MINNQRITLRLFAFLFFSTVMNCSLSAQKTIAGSDGKLNGASWITAKENRILTDSLMFGDHPAPLFRKEFKVAGKLKNATLTITAAGYYHASVNGNRIENNLLDPAWTNFSKRIYYATYDITPMLKSGNNAIGIQLGNGFYNLLPFFKRVVTS